MEEDVDEEKIEEKLFTLRDQLLQLSPTEQKLNCAPIGEQLLPATMETRPQSALCPATNINIQTALLVNIYIFFFLFIFFLY